MMVFLFHFHISCSFFYSLSKSLMFLCSIFFSVLSPKWSHPLAVWSSCLNADHLQICIYPYVFISNAHFKNTPLQIILAGLSAPNPCTVNTELPSSSSVLLYLSLLLLTPLYNFIWVPSSDLCWFLLVPFSVIHQKCDTILFTIQYIQDQICPIYCPLR